MQSLCPFGYHYDIHHVYLGATLMPATLNFNHSPTLHKTAWVM